MLAVTLHGPNYFAPSYDDHSIEVFDTLQDAIEALIERHNANGHSTCRVEYLNGFIDDTHFPTFHEGHYFECYELTASGDRPLTDESIIEALTAVHAGVPDWTLTLADRDGDVVVEVSQ